MDSEVTLMAPDLLRAIRAWVSSAPEPGPAADWAVIQSGLLRANDSDLDAVLGEFFDCEPIVLEVKDVVLSRNVLPVSLRSRLAEALIFHGYDEEASAYIE